MSRRTSADAYGMVAPEGESGRRTSGHRRVASSSSRRRAKTTSGTLSRPKSNSNLRSSLPAPLTRVYRPDRDDDEYYDCIPEHPHVQDPAILTGRPAVAAVNVAVAVATTAGLPPSKPSPTGKRQRRKDGDVDGNARRQDVHRREHNGNAAPDTAPRRQRHEQVQRQRRQEGGRAEDDVDRCGATPSMQAESPGGRDSPTLGHAAPPVRQQPRSTAQPSSDPFGREPGRVAHRSLPIRTEPTSAAAPMPEVTVLVVGSAGVGKSHFIRRALGLQSSARSVLSSRKMLIGGVIYMVRLVELELEHVDLDRDGHMRWPTAVDDVDIPHIDGALVLCDLNRPRSVDTVPALLRSMVAADLPFAFVASTCESPTESRQAQLAICQRAGLVAPDHRVDCLQLPAGASDGDEKRCVGAIVRKVRSRMIDPPSDVAPGGRAESRRARQTSVPDGSSVKRDRHEPDSTGSTWLRTKPRTLASGSSGANADGRSPPLPTSHPSRSYDEGSSTHDAQPHQHHRHRLPHRLQRRQQRQGAKDVDVDVDDGDDDNDDNDDDNDDDDDDDDYESEEDLYHHRNTRRSSSPTVPGVVPRSSALKNQGSTASGTIHAALTAPPTRGRAVAVAATGRTASSAAATTLVIVSDPPFRAPTLPSPEVPPDLGMQSFFKEPDYSSQPSSRGGEEKDDEAPFSTPPRPDVQRVEEDDDDDDDDDEAREQQSPGQPAPMVGETLEALVDRLLAPPVSRADANFPIIFLCLYRKFAAPGQVLTLILNRYIDADTIKGDEVVDATTTRSRHLGVLLQWLLSYPGDFAHPRTRRRLGDLIVGLPPSGPNVHVARDLRVAFDVFCEDDDATWARSDMASPSANAWGLPLSPVDTAVDEVLDGAMRVVSIGSDEGDGAGAGVGAAGGGGTKSARVSGVPSQSSSGENSTTLSGGSSQTLVNTIELAEREAQQLVPAPRISLSKTLWRQFMEVPDADFAQELTRIDWIMFSAIRPRDIVRHITLSAEQRERSKSVENVNRMINQFNHVACWVTNMILLRDKPKHRARALEKFMNIAWRLRKLNNYNALGAIVAGVSGNAVYRLIQTRELVTPRSQKEFMRLEILMGTQKGHFAYRLAWKNTSAPRIPFLPLHRRDLVSADEGNRTFVTDSYPSISSISSSQTQMSQTSQTSQTSQMSQTQTNLTQIGQSRINWKKFEIMGDVIVSIHRSQATPYQDLRRKMEVQRLILDCDLTKDDDALYNRSAELESSTAGGGDTSMRRKFSWFQR